MLKKILKTLLVVTLSLGTFVSNCGLVFAAEKQELSIAVVTTDVDNDLYVTLNNNYKGIKLVSTLDDAIALNEDADSTNDVKGIMVLADNYPNTTTVISAEQANKIETLGVRLYVEYPANNDTLGITGYSGTNVMNYNRGIVTNATAMGMEHHSLLYVHGARFVSKQLTPSSIDGDKYWFVSSKVAGYDVAEYGITEATYSLIEVVDNVMIASTKFSQFISARYAPYGRYQQFWASILSWLTDETVGKMSWNPLVQATFDATDEVTVADYMAAVAANTEWYKNSGFILSEKDAKDYMGSASPSQPAEGAHNNADPVNRELTLGGDGSYGILEAFVSGKAFTETGEQLMRFWRRADCNGESAGNIALAGAILDNDEYTQIAYNVVNWLLTESFMSQGNRANPESAQYGLLTWHDGGSGMQYETYYGDDNAKAVLGLISALAAFRNDTSMYEELGFDSEAKYIEALDKLDKRVLEVIIGNYRTTSTTGMRSDAINGSQLDANGWEYYFNRAVYNYAPHFEALNWATYLWAYGQTGYKPLLERTKTGISLMMAAYEKTMATNSGTSGEWYWTNGLQQERGKMILPLAWLCILEPTEEHIGWLDTMITDMMMYQDEETGALQDRVGEPGQGSGKFGQHTSNAHYGAHEAPVIQNNGDPCIDALYTASFAMMSLNESVAAMNKAGKTALANTYKQYSDKLSDFFVRIQADSEEKTYDGVWFRGFDYEKWEVYGSDGDAAWGVWCTETGWSQSWISNTLSMKVMNTNIWDYTQNSSIENCFEETAILMLNYDPNDLDETITVTPLGRGDKAVLTNGTYGTTKHDDGEWIGTEGKDVTITIDYQEEKTFSGASVGFISNMVSGICPAASVTYYVSNNGTDYEEVGKVTIVENPQALYDANEEAKVVRPVCDFGKEVSARFIKIVVKNPGNYLRVGHETKTDTWLFMDEVELVLTKATKADLYNLLKLTRPLNPSAYEKTSGEAFKAARDAAEAVYVKETATVEELTTVYKNLKTTYEGLKVDRVVLSMTASTMGDSKENLIDGEYSKNSSHEDDEYVAWQDVATIEVVVDLLSDTGIGEVGFSANSRPNSGIYVPNATVYVSKDNANWTKVAYLDAQPHTGDAATPKGVKNTITLDDAYGRYVKFVFENDDDHIIVKRNEWIFMDEVIIERSDYIPPTITVVEGSLAKKDVLVDKVYGITDLNDSRWRDVVAEREGADFTFVVDYGKEKTFDTIKLGALEHFSSGIMSPAKIDVSVSNDNVTFTPLTTIYADGVTNQATYERLTGVVYTTTARYVKVKVYNGGKLPVGHHNAGKDSWVMIDEFEVLNTGEGNKALLKDALESVASIDVNQYTDASAIAFRTEKENVQKLLNDGCDDKAVIDSAVAALNAAKSQLVKLTREVIFVNDTIQNGLDKSKLIDGIQAPSGNWDLGECSDKYLKFKNPSMVVKTFTFVVDLKEETSISNIGFSNTQRPRSGVYTPSAKLFVSNDNATWKLVGTIDAPSQDSSDVAFTYHEDAVVTNETARYVRYELTLSNGQEWLFVDELLLNNASVAKESLQELVNTATTHNSSAYGQSVVAFKEALNDAKALLNKSDVLLSEYGKAYSALSQELDKLLKSPIVTLSASPNTPATNGIYSVIDGVYGTLAGDPVYDRVYLNGQWSGIQNKNLTITIDYRDEIEFNQLTFGLLSNKQFGIGYPKSVKFSVSEDGINYTEYETIDMTTVTTDLPKDQYVVETHIQPVKVQYVKIEITRDGEWFFYDEFTYQTVTVDKTALEVLANEVMTSISGDDYTEESFAKFVSAYNLARATINDGSVLQKEVDEALESLQAAVDGLVSVVELEEEIANAEEKGSYTDETYAAYEEALANAQEVLENPNATKKEVEDAVKAIKEAYEALRINYQVIEGANSQWTKENSDLAIKANGEFASFVRVLVNGSELAERHYTAHEGSTIITFKESYLKSLAAGTYEVTVEFEKGVAKTTFTIKAPTPGTADTNSSTGWMIGLLSSLIAGLGFFVVRRRYNRA